MTADAAICVQGLEKSFKKLDVLRGMDFDVARGSIFALLGSNGAGKTTVVRILSTLLKFDAGVCQGQRIRRCCSGCEGTRPISLTGQFAAVDEILSGRENLVLVAKLRHLDDPGRIADELLGPLLADRRRRAAGIDLFRWHAPPSRHRDEPHRYSADHLSRRTDHWPRPRGPR